MRSFTITALFVFLFVSLLPAQSAQTRPTAIVLPLQAGPGLNADEADLGYAVQAVIENVLIVRGGLEYEGLIGRQRGLFSSADDLSAWVRHQSGAGEPTLNLLDVDLVLRGQVERKGDGLRAEVELWNRKSDKQIKRELAIDLPGLVSFRQGIIEILREAGLPPSSKQTESMLWKEDINLSAFRLLAEGARGDLLAGYGDKPQSVTPLLEAVKQNPESYLLQDSLGVLHHRNEQYDAAKDGFDRAAKINPSGVDSLTGMIYVALKGKDLDAAKSYASRIAVVREEPAAMQYAALYRAAAYVAWGEKDFKGAINYNEQALSIQQEIKDSKGEASTLRNLASAYGSQNQYEKSIADLERALSILREVKSPAEEAATLIELGEASIHLNRFEKASGYFEQALPIQLQLRDRKGEAGTLRDLSFACGSQSQYEKSIAYLEQALSILQDIKDRPGEAATLLDLSGVNEHLNRHEKSIPYLEQALLIQREVKDRAGEAATLGNLGEEYAHLGQNEKAIGCFEQKLSIQKELKDQKGAVSALRDLVRAYGNLSQYEKAITCLEQVLSIQQELKDRKGEASTLRDLALGYGFQNQYERSIPYLEKALPVLREVKDRAGEAATLSSLAGCYGNLNELEKSIPYLEQALLIQREVTDRKGEATSLTSLGASFTRLGAYDKAAAYFEQALPILREIKDRAAEGAALGGLGFLYTSLKQPEKGVGYFEQALPIEQELKNPDGQLVALNALGMFYKGSGKYDKAIQYFEQALPIAKSSNNSDVNAMTQYLLCESYDSALDYQKAIGCYKQALPMALQQGDMNEAGKINYAIGTNYLNHQMADNSIAYFKQALDVVRSLKGRDGEVEILNSMAMAFLRQKDNAQAIVCYEEAVEALRETTDQKAQAKELSILGNAYLSVTQDEKAIERLKEALSIEQESKDADGEARVLDELIEAYNELRMRDKALEFYERLLNLYRERKNESAEAQTMQRLGATYGMLNNSGEAIKCFQSAASIYHRLRDKKSEAAAYNGIGVTFQATHEYEKAIGYYERAFALQSESKDTFDEIELTYELGTANRTIYQYESAIYWYKQSRLLALDANMEDDEAQALLALGEVYGMLGERKSATASYEEAQKTFHGSSDSAKRAHVLDSTAQFLSLDNYNYEMAVEDYKQSASAQRDTANLSGEASTLLSMGEACIHLGQYEEAITHFERSLKIADDIRDQVTKAEALHGLGQAYSALNDGKGDEYYEQALKIAQEIKLREREAIELSALVDTECETRAACNKFIDRLDRVIAISRETRDRALESDSLNKLGSIYGSLGDHSNAVGRYEQSIKIAREIRRPDLTGKALSLMGKEYTHFAIDCDVAGEKNKAAFSSADCSVSRQKAGTLMQQALAIYRRIGERESTAETLSNLMLFEFYMGRHPRVAIYYGKQAVSTYQSIRGDMRGLSKTLRKEFAASVSDTYSTLAFLLAKEGRIWEAEHVINLLKEDEALDFAGGNPDLSTSGVPLSPHEEKIRKLDDEFGRHLEDQSDRRASLPTSTELHASDVTNSAHMAEEIRKVEDDYVAFLRGLPTEFSQTTPVADAAPIDKSKSIASRLSPGVVAVYSVMEMNSYLDLLFTTDTAIVREYPISRLVLNTKAQTLHRKLMNRSEDPLPEAQEMYKILVGPIENDLETAHASTILWSLEGPLRRLPVAALHDGKLYMIEKYNLAMFSSVREAGSKPTSWKALALGVSKAHHVNGSDFAALPNVPRELREVVHEDNGSQGAVPGMMRLDEQFTWNAAMEDLRRLNPTVVHIASHFEFNRDRLSDSYLLLGDGGVLPLSEIRKEKNLFRNVDLLTLSACNTAVEGDGREVDSFAKIAQDEGAQSVLASLWSVNDPSTSELMGRFYALHESNPNMSKAEALREAQLSLLHGGKAINAKDATAVAIDDRTPRDLTSERSAWVTDSTTGFVARGAGENHSRPYYWAPFILMGNWR